MDWTSKRFPRSGVSSRPLAARRGSFELSYTNTPYSSSTLFPPVSSISHRPQSPAGVVVVVIITRVRREAGDVMVVGIDDSEHSYYGLEWTLQHFFAVFLMQVIDVSYEAIEGDARSVICDAVDRHHAEILVVGCHGYSKWKRSIHHLFDARRN